MTGKLETKTVDNEWFELIKEAKNLGIPLQEIKVFLSSNKKG
ncbi:DNA-binding anti-repressor SinI [Virgibacillus halodenitrificans]|nr:DNA-binding anti-repressor SinI [Virgibacillus halodenitrificans]MEC2160549.1 DNA-binding anti-repressor SinI [Virgibacillus halodenitrificans]